MKNKGDQWTLPTRYFESDANMFYSQGSLSFLSSLCYNNLYSSIANIMNFNENGTKISNISKEKVTIWTRFKPSISNHNPVAIIYDFGIVSKW